MTRDSGKKNFDYWESQPEAMEVFSWCPTPQPTVPATQVHLHVPIAGARVVVRFKGHKTLDALIAALVSHREDVWGKP